MDLHETPHKIIIFNNKDCQFVSTDEKLIEKLRYLLSFKMEGVEYSAAFQNGWNGTTFLMTKKGNFALGLKNKVTCYLEKNNISFVVEDRRAAKISETSINLYPKLSSFSPPIIPRDYQERIVAETLKYDKGIIRACTGAGKSLVAALVTAQHNTTTNIYVISISLLQQFHDLFSSLFEEEIGWVGNGICNIKRINIVSIWTAARSLNVSKKDIISSDEEMDEDEKFNEDNVLNIKKMLATTQLHILDECHVSSTATLKAIYSAIDPYRIYGMSATPEPSNNTILLSNSILGDQIADVSAAELIEKKVLAQPIIKFIDVPKKRMSGDSNYQNVYKEYIVDNNIRNNLIVEATKNLLEKKYVPLVLFKQINHGNILAQLFEENNIKYALLSGKDSLKEREKVREDLKNKTIDVILASTIFDIGIDIPMLSGLVLAGSGKTRLKTLQRIGRCLRIIPGKTHSAIVDFYDQVKYLKNHSSIRYNIYKSEKGFKVLPNKNLK